MSTTPVPSPLAVLRSFPANGPIDEDLAREGYILASFNGQEPQPVILESAGEIGTIRISTLRNAISPSTRNFNLVTTVGTRQVHNPLSVVNDVTVYGFHAGYTYTFSAGADVALEPLPAGKHRTRAVVVATFFFSLAAFLYFRPQLFDFSSLLRRRLHGGAPLVQLPILATFCRNSRFYVLSCVPVLRKAIQRNAVVVLRGVLIQFFGFFQFCVARSLTARVSLSVSHRLQLLHPPPSLVKLCSSCPRTRRSLLRSLRQVSCWLGFVGVRFPVFLFCLLPPIPWG
jgi:hypothetical protein